MSMLKLLNRFGFGKPTDMNNGDTIETTYKDKDIILEYIISEGYQYELHFYRATIKESNISKSAFFRFWRTPERTAKIACKRAYKLDNKPKSIRSYPRHTETTLR